MVVKGNWLVGCERDGGCRDTSRERGFSPAEVGEASFNPVWMIQTDHKSNPNMKWEKLLAIIAFLQHVYPPIVQLIEAARRWTWAVYDWRQPMHQQTRRAGARCLGEVHGETLWTVWAWSGQMAAEAQNVNSRKTLSTQLDPPWCQKNLNPWLQRATRQLTVSTDSPATKLHDSVDYEWLC